MELYCNFYNFLMIFHENLILGEKQQFFWSFLHFWKALRIIIKGMFFIILIWMKKIHEKSNLQILGFSNKRVFKFGVCHFFTFSIW